MPSPPATAPEWPTQPVSQGKVATVGGVEEARRLDVELISLVRARP